MLAAIDVGSNTVRMLFGRVEQGRMVPVFYERAITRLGGNYNEDRGLAPESMERTLVALKNFSTIIEKQSPDAIRMVGTAALRRAGNRSLFVNQVAQQTGLHLEVIDGQQEASLSARGVLDALDPQPKVSLVIDIGGGSTELILLSGSQVRFRESYPLGVVRLCEENADNTSRQKVITEVLDLFASDLLHAGLDNLILQAVCEFVGTAGTVTTLAAIDQQMECYDWRKINNHILPLQTLSDQCTMLQPMSVEQREEIPGLESGRGDLIMPGIEILLALAKRFSRPQIRVSDFGLLEGILLDLSTSSID